MGAQSKQVSELTGLFQQRDNPGNQSLTGPRCSPQVRMHNMELIKKKARNHTEMKSRKQQPSPKMPSDDKVLYTAHVGRDASQTTSSFLLALRQCGTHWPPGVTLPARSHSEPNLFLSRQFLYVFLFSTKKRNSLCCKVCSCLFRDVHWLSPNLQ